MPFRVAAAAYACIVILAFALIATRSLEALDNRILDAQFSALRSWWPRPVQQDVVIVGIDDETVRQLPEPLTLWHRHIGSFLQATAAGGAAAVGLDIVLPDRSYEKIVPGLDAALLAGIVLARRAAPLVLAVTVDPEGSARPIFAPFVTAAGNDGTGYALLPADRDGVARRFDQRLGAGGISVPLLAGQIAQRLGASPRNGLIDYSRGAEFDYLPLHVLLRWHETGDTASLRRALAGKPVLLGSVLKFEDRVAAPVNFAAWDHNAGTVPGVMIHAQALRNLLGSGLIGTVPAWVVFVLCLVAALSWFASGRLKIAIVIAAAGTVMIIAGATWLLSRGWHFPPSPVLATLGVAVVARSTREAVLQSRERRKLRQSFAGYVSPAVMEEILAGDINPELGGRSRFVCVLFADIRGYTTRSEGMTPQQLVEFLNSYFEGVVNVIHQHGGSVLSFIGDGIMAIFGAPKPLENPSAEAFAASRAILKYVRQFNEASRASGGGEPVDIGIGLHAGDAVIGHVGASSRHDYTAIGDVCNVAARLEGITKEVGFRLVCSDVVTQELSLDTGPAALGRQAIRGHSPVECYGFEKV